MAAPGNFPGGIVALTAQAVDALISQRDGDAALLYLCLSRTGGGGRDDAGKRLGWTGERVLSAWQTLERLGLVDPRTPPETPKKLDRDLPPEYPSELLTRELETASPFSLLVGETQNCLGKVLSAHELRQLYTIYDFLALPPEVILLLLHHCVKETEKKLGVGRRPRMSQIRREAFLWQKAGVDTAEAADAYIKRQDALREGENRLLPLLGIHGRAAVEGERKYLSVWLDWGFSDDAIALAFERTVMKKGGMSWAYMNSILKNWHAAGLHTAAQVEVGDGRPAPAAAPNAPSPRKGQTGDADRKAREDMERMRRFLERQKETKGGTEHGI